MESKRSVPVHKSLTDRLEQCQILFIEQHEQRKKDRMLIVGDTEELPSDRSSLQMPPAAKRGQAGTPNKRIEHAEGILSAPLR